MQLSRLEVKGFKSFGERVVLHFDHGITGVVGPNGCGKSNIVDAIRWVLGEQRTRNLRSEKMDNIIFNGTKNRKPLQMAEASLTFRNDRQLLPTEYSEVTITRRYYRSGESEYLLNGVACRLKDITTLFMDTGIGPDSYAIIELKMVDDLLNDRDNARRHLFEEAAGIAKFKVRKKQALKKLEDTDQDLDRVEDLLFEIEKNLRQLERQAKQAQRYQELKVAYRTQSLQLARTRIGHFSEQQRRLATQLAEGQAQHQAYTMHLEASEAALVAQKQQLDACEQLWQQRQRTRQDCENYLRAQENQQKIWQERTALLQRQQNTLALQVEEDRQLGTTADHQRAERVQQLEAASQQLARLEAECEVAQSDLYAAQQQIEREQQQQAALENAWRDAQRAYFEHEKQYEVRQTQLRTLRRELERVALAAQGFEQVRAESGQKLRELEAAAAAEQVRMTDLQKAEQRRFAALDAAAHAAKECQQALAYHNRQLDALQHERRLLQSWIDNLEGFPETVRYLRQHPSQRWEAPLVAELFICPEAYRPALERCLEPFLHTFVVADRSTALSVAQHLRHEQRGRAQFFILNELLPTSTLTPPLAAPGVAAALSVVSCDPSYAPLAAHLLAGVFFCPPDWPLPDSANGYFVALDGTWLWQPGWLSGGATGALEGRRVDRKTQLHELEARIATQQVAVAQLESALRKTEDEQQRLRQATQRLAHEEAQHEWQRLQRDMVMIRTRQEQFAQQQQVQHGQAQQWQDQLDDLQDALVDDEPHLDAARRHLAQLESQRQAEQTHLVQRRHQLAKQSAEVQQLIGQCHTQRGERQHLEQEVRFLAQNAQATRQRLAQREAQWAQIAHDLAQLPAPDDNAAELDGLRKELAAVAAGAEAAEQAYFAARGKLDALDRDIRETRRKRENDLALRATLQQKLNEVEMQLLAVRERLSVEFGVAPEELEADSVANVGAEQLKAEVDDIRQKLEKLGPVNPMALDAYREIKERYDFIAEQRDDLRAAKQSLLTTIQDIDAVARQQFAHTYEQIRQHFQHVFRTLFTEEDACDLKLVEPDNPLDSRIEIMAHPKGKRPLTINQLSGGEKTLTAISLLFAIYLIKPAPFCIFDEVDAPLDDANIDKFNQIIKKFSTDSQFIIVTHNKRTMTHTDVIYGVTMLEAGISRVIPVDLRALA